MVIPWKFLLLVVVAACLVLAAWLAYHETRIPQNQGEVLNRMIELQREGRYDKAVQVVQNWMKDNRRDISYDEFLYHQIAMIYIVKAYKRPKTRDDSIRQSELNLKEAHRLFDLQQVEDDYTRLFGIAGAYDILRDISDQCKYRLYEIGRHCLERH